jgi:hypothetical protein
LNLSGNQLSNNVLIFKIRDYANFSLENSYVPTPTDPTVSSTSTLTSSPTPSSAVTAAVIGSIGSILSVLGIIGFFCFKKYKKARDNTFAQNNGKFRKHANIWP